MSRTPPAYYVGLISGTSMDGIDAALMAYDSSHNDSPIRLLAARTYPFATSIQGQLQQAKDLAEENPQLLVANDWVQQLDGALAEAFAEAARSLIDEAGLTVRDITAIGSHGQTLSHQPEAQPPQSLQLGNPQQVASITQIPTVGQFRQDDLAAGGQGAPLAPLIHQALFAHPQSMRAVLNLGGIANVTVLKPNEPVIGFDTGPANVLLDHWYQTHHVGTYDRSGQWARSGRAHEALLDQCLADPYFKATPPKSTSIEYFGPRWLKRHLGTWHDIAPEDIQATLAELTAQSIHHALAAHEPIETVIVCGGGVHNQDLMARLQQGHRQTDWLSSDDFGFDPDHLESLLFAWLAHQRIHHQALDTTSITGAHHPITLGQVFTP